MHDEYHKSVTHSYMYLIVGAIPCINHVHDLRLEQGARIPTRVNVENVGGTCLLWGNHFFVTLDNETATQIIGAFIVTGHDFEHVFIFQSRGLCHRQFQGGGLCRGRLLGRFNLLTHETHARSHGHGQGTLQLTFIDHVRLVKDLSRG